MKQRCILAVMMICLLLGLAHGQVPSVHASQAQHDSPGQVSTDARRDLAQVMTDSRFSQWKIRQQRLDHVRVETLTFDEKIKAYLESMRGSFNRFWRWLFPRTPSAPNVNTAAGSMLAMVTLIKVVAWLLVGVTLLLLAWFLLSRWRNRQASMTARTVTRQALTEAMATGQALAASSDDWTAHAISLAQEQDMRRAFRAMYLALLSGLHNAGQIRYRPQQTNWVYVTGFKGEHEQREIFAQLTSQFDDIWYGQREPDRPLFDSIHRRIDELLGRARP